MSQLKNNEIKVTTYADDSINVEFGAEVPAEQRDYVVELFKSKGAVVAQSDQEVVSSDTWQLRKADGDELPYWHPKAQMEHRKKLRTMEVNARRAATAAPAAPAPKLNPTSGIGPSGVAVRADGMPLAGGMNHNYGKIPNKPVKPLKQSEMVKFDANGQWSLDKSHMGFKAMEHKLEDKGHSKESADKIAAAIGRKKYGAKQFAEMAHKSEEPMKKGAWTQPSDQELFGHLVPSEEQVKKAEDSFNNGINNFFNEVKKPVESQDFSKSWGSRGPIKDERLTEEEERIRQIPVDPSLTKGE